MSNANIQYANDEETFKNLVINSDKPVLVDFYADWCGPCKAVAPEIDKIADEKKDTLNVVKVDVDANVQVASQYQVMSIPTLGLFKEGQLVARTMGAMPKDRILQSLGI